MNQSLHLRIMAFISLTILIIISASTLLFVRHTKQNYLETIEWRSVTLAQRIRVFLISRHEQFGELADADLILESAYLECKQIYDANQHLHVAFVSLLSEDGKIIIHNNIRLWRRQLTAPELRSALKTKKTRTILLENQYHTLIPVITQKGTYLGTIDVGFPKEVVDATVLESVRNALLLCLILFLASFFPTWFFIRHAVTLPISRLIQATSQIAQGDLQQKIYASRSREFRNLAQSLTKMRDAIHQNMRDLDQKNQEIKALIACSPVALFSLDLEDHVAIWTASAEQLLGWQAEEVLGRPFPSIPDQHRELFEELQQEVLQGKVVMGYEILQKKKDDSVFHASLSSAPIRDSHNRLIGVMGTIEDISERIEREKAHQKVQAQLLQAQKMESVGRLAGGVAHDYNNTLGVILGYAELMLEDLPKGDPKSNDLREIIKATLHSADITRQLLAFAKKQTISPKILNLNECVENILKMLKRLIGENIDLEWIPQASLGTVKMDMVQVDQILANLCINARDAIKDTGKITIETRSATVTDDYCGSHPEFRPGEFVCLTVSDNGTGMEKEVVEKIFEPFFTTKGRAEGTGLGLSTVYGIVKQNKGFINVYSEPGKGTTFNLYFPKTSEKAKIEHLSEVEDIQTGKGELILLVEDDASILKLSKQILKNLGYQVIATQSPPEAILFARENKARIRMLITDVILPDMNGRELSAHIQAICPDTKTLYMSGYTANVIAHQGILDDGVNFLQKPFSKKDLALRVQQILSQKS